MTSVVTIASMTIRQILGVKRFIGLSLLVASPAVIFLLTTGGATGVSFVEIFIALTVGVFFSVAVPVVSLIMASSALGDERRDDTLSFIVLRPIPRAAIAAAKLSGALATAYGLTFLGAAGLGLTMGLRGDWSMLGPIVIGALVATIAYVSLFLPLGYLTERATLIGLAFVFIWETAIAGTIPGLAATSPWRIGFSAFADLAPAAARQAAGEFAVGNIAPGVGGAFFKVLILAVVSITVTTALLRTRDLV